MSSSSGREDGFSDGRWSGMIGGEEEARWRFVEGDIGVRGSGSSEDETSFSLRFIVVARDSLTVTSFIFVLSTNSPSEDLGPPNSASGFFSDSLCSTGHRSLVCGGV